MEIPNPHPRRRTVTKRDLAKQVGASVGVSVENAEKSITALLEAIRRAVGAGGRVELRKFGVFEPRFVRERSNSGYHAITGKPLHMGSSVRFKFRTARGLKNLKVGG